MSIAPVRLSRTESAVEPAVPDIAGLVALARAYAEDPASWTVRPRFEPSRRWYARLAEASGHEAWLLTWMPGQETDLHDHGGSAGAFVVVRGALTEATVQPLANGRGHRRVPRGLAAGTVRAFGSNHIHHIRNEGPAPAISVHVYAPALHSMTRYRLAGRRLAVESVSSAGKDW
jgi:hypothetical protein